jgi:C4-dicarboxylate-specific signal transduction histidine kinase
VGVDWRNFLEYERRLNQALVGQKMLVLCAYPLSSRKAGDVFDVAEAHEFVIAKRHGQWQTLETPELKHTKNELAAIKRAEKAVRESQQLLDLVLATLPVGVAVTDQAGNIVLENSASKRIWGDIMIVSGRERWARSKGSWHDSGDPIAPADWASVRALSKGQTSLNELIDIETYDRQRKTIQNSAAPIRNAEGLIVGAVIVNEDVTERVRAEEALGQAQEELANVGRRTMIGELTASIAHEINQPLAGVVTNANACQQWLAGKKPNIAEARKAIGRIARDGRRAGDVIARVRSLLQKGEPVRALLHINQVVRTTASLVQSELRQKKVTLRLDLAPELPRLSADRVQLEQVIMNLLLNAVDALAEVTKRARVLRIRTVGPKRGVVRVEIRDTGVGVDSEQAKHLFEAFFTTKPNGVGLGLAISRSIVEAHGGRLWATPNHGPGMTFQFTLPVQNRGAS